VDFDRSFAESEGTSNLFIGSSLDEKLKNFALARREALVSSVPCE
jgi:hypothetical protein